MSITYFKKICARDHARADSAAQIRSSARLARAELCVHEVRRVGLAEERREDPEVVAINAVVGNDGGAAVATDDADEGAAGSVRLSIFAALGLVRLLIEIGEAGDLADELFEEGLARVGHDAARILHHAILKLAEHLVLRMYQLPLA